MPPMGFCVHMKFVSEGKEGEEEEEKIPPVDDVPLCSTRSFLFIFNNEREKKRKEEMVATFSLELFKSPKVCRPVCTSK